LYSACAVTLVALDTIIVLAFLLTLSAGEGAHPNTHPVSVFDALTLAPNLAPSALVYAVASFVYRMLWVELNNVYII